MTKIDIDNMSNEIMSILDEFKDVTIETVEKAVKETAKETVKELKFTSPQGATGDYAKSWKYKRDTEAKGINRYNLIVCSEKPEYRLTHLLEYGHAIKSGGRTVGKAEAFSHIKDAEKNAENRLMNKILSGLGGK